MHHIKHVRKGKLSGFSEVMKNLKPKTNTNLSEMLVKNTSWRI